MLAIAAPADERLTPARRAKFAYIYVRQFSVGQVKHHGESTQLQYRLVDRAVGLGWPRVRIPRDGGRSFQMVLGAPGGAWREARPTV